MNLSKSVRIPLTQGQYAIIDREDLPKVSKYRWFAIKIGGRFYAYAHGKKCEYLHRIVMNAADDEKTKFIGDSKLDCRKSNIIKWKIEHSNRRPYVRKRLRVDKYRKIKTPHGTKIRIPLTKGFFALIDPRDFNLVSQYTWRTFGGEKSYYAATTLKSGGSNYGSKILRMHNLIMGPKASERVDHRDRDGFNNTRKNLRICSRFQNNQNRRKKKDGQYKYKGISFNYGSWGARIQFSGIVKLLGRYKTDIEAAQAYDEAAKKYHGDFACLNFPEKK